MRLLHSKLASKTFPSLPELMWFLSSSLGEAQTWGGAELASGRRRFHEAQRRDPPSAPRPQDPLQRSFCVGCVDGQCRRP